MKRTRDNLYKHTFIYLESYIFGINKVASWAHIVEFYSRDSKQ